MSNAEADGMKKKDIPMNKMARTIPGIESGIFFVAPTTTAALPLRSVKMLAGEFKTKQLIQPLKEDRL